MPQASPACHDSGVQVKLSFVGVLVSAILVASSPVAVVAQEQSSTDQPANDVRSQLRQLNWVKGPQTIQMFGNSSINVPQGYVFLGTADTSKFQSLMQNLDSGQEYFFGPSDLHWESFFSYGDDGYVKDDEKIDADAILKNITDSTRAGNEQRRQRGWDEMEVVGWQTPPYYDAATHHLEWAIRGRDQKTGEEVVNFNTRILGRGGVMSVVLVSSPDALAASISELKNGLQGFDYLAGQKYAEYRPGDKVAKYGLAALITGGAAAVAVKTGLWKVVVGALVAGWKFVVAAVVALLAGIRNLFRRKQV